MNYTNVRISLRLTSWDLDHLAIVHDYLYRVHGGSRGCDRTKLIRFCLEFTAEAVEGMRLALHEEEQCPPEQTAPHQ